MIFIIVFSLLTFNLIPASLFDNDVINGEHTHPFVVNYLLACTLEIVLAIFTWVWYEFYKSLNMDPFIAVILSFIVLGIVVITPLIIYLSVKPKGK